MGTHSDTPTDEPRNSRSNTTTYTRAPDELPSESVVRAVAAVTGTEPMALDPLYGSIDPDALDAVVESAPTTGEEGLTSSVRFRYQGTTVTIHGDGRTIVSPVAAD
ncbi:hypothetical protein SAMN05216559_3350 [Halomicrobium zhouii]|uniref:Halobacterial output domain-containing protein n=1 Tax=Halomicrobium zhouii TaxID=767519 RepID=A0A1I6LXF1_9EURY|nr:HalOD1 output domain-containing protein [Halomicrobium zhouii]SFS08090.1 hypothetical protein SAMN05216559_3350 [Halomicrobium zhouii]